MICAQSDLSKADEGLARTFTSALAATLRPATLHLDQIGWLSERDKLATADDLRAAYRDRAAELSGLGERWRKFRHAVPLEEAGTGCLTPPRRPARHLHGEGLRGRRGRPGIALPAAGLS